MNAFILIAKNPGPSSFGLIQALRSCSGIRKIGHAGTLDPFAGGLLICALGQYTRLLSYAEAKDKVYEATVQLGISTDTGDPEGKITAQKELRDFQPDPQELSERALALNKLQLPRYSAIKISGKRAYQYAREGVQLEMPMREVKIHSFELLESPQRDQINYRVKVSKGTYIRAFSEWLAAQYHTIGHTVKLTRTQIGDIDLAQACPAEDIQNWQNYLFPAKELLSHLPSYQANKEEAALIKHGNALQALSTLPHPEYAVYDEAGRLIAIANTQADRLKPRLVFDPAQEHA